MDWVVISLMVGGLIALIPAWRMAQAAYFLSRWRIATLLSGLLLAGLLAAMAWWLPFYLSQGKTVEPHHTLTDLLLFGVAPLALLALAGYVADHFAEGPIRCLLSAAACFAIALLPILYFFYADAMHAYMDIQILADQGMTGLPQPIDQH